MMRKTINRWAAIALCIAAGTASAQQGTENGQWRNYGGDLGSSKYSPLDQISKSNVKDLQVAWRWSSPDNPIAGGDRRKTPGAYKATPLMVDGVLYATTSYSIIAALDPTTGKELWTFDPKVHEGRRPTNLGFNTRGLAFWSDGKGDNRILFGTNRAKLYCLNADTGKLIESFGEGGIINMPDQYRRPVDARLLSNVSPPLVINDTVVLGMVIFDGPTIKEMPPGDVHAFDVRTGKKKWTFNNPPLKGQAGYDTWKDGSAEYTGNANVWTIMSADPELGYVYLPFGTPTNDWYGGHRKGKNDFAESIVCVEAETGKYVWHFQHVHHGLWDYDIPAAPALVDITWTAKKSKPWRRLPNRGSSGCWTVPTANPSGPLKNAPFLSPTYPEKSHGPPSHSPPSQHQ